jgi:HK97 family phage prohead protease
MPDIDELGIETLRSFFYGDRRFRDRDNAEVAWRASGDPDAGDVRILTGYPAVFGQETVLYESERFVMKEVIAPGFFDDVLRDDCHLNYSHESPSAMCRNGLAGPGGMELSVDSHGLRVYAQVPMDDLDAQRLAPKMDRGVVTQMSFAFAVAEEDCLQTTDPDGREVYLYTLKRCARLYDVCVCPIGAYTQTEAMLRTVFSSQIAGRSPEGPPTVPDRSVEGQEGQDDRAPKAGRSSARSTLIADGVVALASFKPREEGTT